MNNSPYRIILFDVSGVLAEFKGSRALRHLALKEPDPERLARRRREGSHWVKQWESGQCSDLEFAEGFLAAWPLQITAQEFFEELHGWPRGLYPGVAQLLSQLRGRIRLAVLTNTNPLHWPIVRDRYGLGRLIPRQYVSYEIGLLKPDPRAYEHVIADLQMEPGEILFLDDRRENVDSARAIGIEARETKGIDAVRAELEAVGLLG